MAIINVVADLHNFNSLKKILKDFDNLFCLGDIGAVMDFGEFLDNKERYGHSWKAFSKNELSSILDGDKKWFEKINIDAWKRQLDSINNSKNKFILVQGNCDDSMLNFHSECKSYLELNKSPNFSYLQIPEIKVIDNVQLIILPFQNKSYEITSILRKINPNKKLFILTHCPAMENAKKQYYTYCYSAAKQISAIYSGEICYLHGHIHPTESYKYSREGLSNITFMAPKSEENEKGISLNQHIIKIDSLTGKITLFDSVSKKEVLFKPLPEKYLLKESHWNEFDY